MSPHNAICPDGECHVHFVGGAFCYGLFEGGHYLSVATAHLNWSFVTNHQMANHPSIRRLRVRCDRAARAGLVLRQVVHTHRPSLSADRSKITLPIQSYSSGGGSTP